MKIIITENQRKNLFEQKNDDTYYDSLGEILDDYYYYGQFSFNSKRIVNKKLKHIFDCLINIIDELKKYHVDSSDFSNYNNLGYNEKGDLCYFDIGYGNFYEEFEDHPEEMDLNELDLKIDDGVVNKILRAYNPIKITKLGDGGNFGSAYDLGNDTVLKITTDKTEAINSKKLIGKDTQYLSKIYDVKHIKYMEKVFYIIHLEKLTVDINLPKDFMKLNDEILKSENNNFKYEIVNMIKKKHPEVGQFLEHMCKMGYEKTWSRFKSFIEKYPEYDFNEISDISEWVFGSKTNDNSHKDEPPQSIRSLVKSLL